MARIAIVTDSTSDLDRDELAARGIEVVPLGLQIGNEVFLDRVDISSAEFFDRLSLSSPHPTTFSPAASGFEAVFRRLGQDHDAIIAVLLSSKLGGSVRAATAAVTAVSGQVHVEIVDSMNASLGLGFQALHASDLARSGLELDELVQRLRSETRLYHLAFFVDNLEHLQHGGRIGLAASLVGGILQLKPLLRIDEGQVVPLERTRTRAKATAGLIDFAKSFSRIDRLGVVYSTGAADAESLRAALAATHPMERTTVAQFSPVLSAHVGPGALGICIFEGPEPLD